MDRRLALSLLFSIACMSPCRAQTAEHIFVDPATGAVSHFPGALEIRDPAKELVSGHLNHFGSMANEADAHAMAGHCVKNLVIADLPYASGQDSANAPALRTARLTLFDFSLAKECTAGFRYHDDDAVAGGVAQAIAPIPGAKPIGPPIWAEWGKEKLHVYIVALGDDVKKPALVATATLLWKGHVLGWMLAADSLATFNEFGKVRVDLAPGRTYQIPFRVEVK